MISTRDNLVKALGPKSSPLIFYKASLSNMTTGGYVSGYLLGTVPSGGGSAPGAAAPCNTTMTLTAPQFVQQPAGNTSYLTEATVLNTNSNWTIEIHDRIAHMGGLSGTVVGAQTANVNLNDFLDRDNIDHRKGDSNFSDITWWLEWYLATGGTGVNAVISVQFNDGSTANLTTFALAATRRANFMQPLNGYIQAADAGKFIRSVNTVHLSATTGTAGTFGVTATRQRAVLPVDRANEAVVYNWEKLGLPEVANSAHLQLIYLASTTTTGVCTVKGTITHG